MTASTPGWLPHRARTAWKGGTVKGGACAIALATRPEGAPLTGPSWRATQSEADEAPIEEMTCQDRYRPCMCQTVAGAQ